MSTYSDDTFEIHVRLKFKVDDGQFKLNDWSYWERTKTQTTREIGMISLISFTL